MVCDLVEEDLKVVGDLLDLMGEGESSYVEEEDETLYFRKSGLRIISGKMPPFNKNRLISHFLTSVQYDLKNVNWQ